MISNRGSKKLIETLPANYIKILYKRLDELQEKYSESYIQKVVKGRRKNVTILNEALKLAEEYKAQNQIINNRANKL